MTRPEGIEAGAQQRIGLVLHQNGPDVGSGGQRRVPVQSEDDRVGETENTIHDNQADDGGGNETGEGAPARGSAEDEQERRSQYRAHQRGRAVGDEEEVPAHRERDDARRERELSPAIPRPAPLVEEVPEEEEAGHEREGAKRVLVR